MPNLLSIWVADGLGWQSLRMSVFGRHDIPCVHLKQVEGLRRLGACRVDERSRRNAVRLALAHHAIVLEKVLDFRLSRIAPSEMPLLPPYK